MTVFNDKVLLCNKACIVGSCFCFGKAISTGAPMIIPGSNTLFSLGLRGLGEGGEGVRGGRERGWERLGEGGREKALKKVWSYEPYRLIK